MLCFQLSASSAALDLALSASPGPDASSTRGWSNVNRHRPQHSLPIINNNPAQQTSSLASLNSSRNSSVRNSLDLNYLPEITGDPSNGIMTSQGSGNSGIATPPKLQSSFSTNDVPTIKNQSSSSMTGPNANNHAQQHFHNHNASMGRIPVGAVSHRHSREMSADAAIGGSREQSQAFQSIQSALQASAAPFGPSTAAAAPLSNPAVSSPNGNGHVNNFNGFFPPNNYGMPGGGSGFNSANGSSGGNMPNALNSSANMNNGMGTMANPPNGLNNGNNYGMHMLTSGMQGMSVNTQAANGYNPQNYGSGYVSPSFNNGAGSGSSTPQTQQPRDSQARVIQNRRQMDNEGKFQHPILYFVIILTIEISYVSISEHAARVIPRSNLRAL